MPRNAPAALAAAFLALGLTACTGGGSADDGPDEAPGTADERAAELVEWAEAFCAAPEAIPTLLYVPFTAAAHNTPTTDEDRQPLIDALADADQALADAMAAADTVPPGPAPEAEAALAQYRADLEETRGTLAEYAEIAPVYASADLEGLYMLAGMDVMNLPYSLMMAETYLTEPDLAEAAANAPACGGGPGAEEPSGSASDST
ncbi:hypothetical protein [Glycomyces harbinensis]|uniref:Uncharacterized protein n=1 Tax=Glycomyces harbinensis TaxID=58114 RepID=A0A1G6XBI0_9ACTN|nr:hypothetical protein [Glycomyces harbinensis]SDD75441.1 hypothetical protein SAMN05216270_10779 [Glycomyces harbinensis]